MFSLSTSFEEEETEKIDKESFLGSLLNFYPDGILLQINRIGNIFENQFRKEPTVFVDFKILGNMKKCLAKSLNPDGSVKSITDELGNSKPELVKVEATGKIVSIAFNLKSTEDPEEYRISNLSSFYPLLSYALMKSKIIENTHSKDIVFNYSDLETVLSGLKFNGKSEKVKSKKFKPYLRLIPEDPILEVMD